MNIFHEIRSQPPMVRKIMYWLSVVTTLGIIGFFWVTSIEKNMFFALHTDPAERQQFVDQQDAHLPQPLALISRGFGSLTASIGALFGFDTSKGLTHTADAPHPLPLSK